LVCEGTFSFNNPANWEGNPSATFKLKSGDDVIETKQGECISTDAGDGIVVMVCNAMFNKKGKKLDAKRDEKIYCEVSSEIDNMCPEKSEELVVAKHLYIFGVMGEKGDYGDLKDGLKEQYETYVGISDINGGMNIGKPIYVTKEIPYYSWDSRCTFCSAFNYEECSQLCNTCKWKRSFFGLGRGECVFSFSREKYVLNNIKNKYDKKRDDKIVIGTPRIEYVFGQTGGAFVESRPALVVYLGFPDLKSQAFAFTHEMGHASLNSKLCDEYTYPVWDRLNKNSRCPNPYPKCCPGPCDYELQYWLESCEGVESLQGMEREVRIDNKNAVVKCFNQKEILYVTCNPDFSSIIDFGCGILQGTESCFGMPYEENEETKDETWPGWGGVPFGPKLSIMGDWDNRNSLIADLGFVGAKEKIIYPVEAGCPLKNC